jgi:Ssu72-like protein
MFSPVSAIVSNKEKSENSLRNEVGKARAVDESILSFSLVCACNMNRSMSAHQILINNGYKNVASFGTSDCVRLPHATGPREFMFETAYAEMHASMCVGGFTYWMNRSGISDILHRNANIKRAPSRWQNQSDSQAFEHTIAICYDGHVYDSVVADVQQRLSAYRVRASEAFERASLAAAAAAAASVAFEARSDARPRIVVSRSSTPQLSRQARTSASATLDSWIVSSSSAQNSKSSLITPKQEKRSVSVEVEEEPVNLDALAHHALQHEKLGSAEKTPSSVSTVFTARSHRLIQSNSDNFTPSSTSSSTNSSMSIGSASALEKSSKKSQKRSAFSSPESQKVILRSRITQAAISGSVVEPRGHRDSFEDLLDSEVEEGAEMDDSDMEVDEEDGERKLHQRNVQSSARPSSSTPSSIDEELHRSVRTMIFSEGAQSSNPKGSSTVPVCPSTPLPVPVSTPSSPLRRMASAPAIVAPTAHESTRPLVVILLQTSDTIENAQQAAIQTLEFANCIKQALAQEARFADAASSTHQKTLSAATLLEIIEPAVTQLRRVADGAHARLSGQQASRSRFQAPQPSTSRIRVTGFDVPLHP